MKFNKILMSFACTAMLFGSAACTDEVEYTPAEPSPVTKYYFPTTNTLSYDILDGSKSFSVTIARASSDEEETVAIKSSVTPDNPFDIPENVTFAKGEGSKVFEIKYNTENLVVNQPYAITLELEGIVNTPYSWGTMTIDALYLPWRDFEAKESMGLYRENLMTSVYRVQSLVYEVKIQRHPTNDNIYRLINPYGKPYPYNEEGDYDDTRDYYMIVNCEDPEGVYWQLGWTGLNWSEDAGEVWFNSKAYNNIAGGQTLAQVKAAGLCGTIKNGIIKMPASSALFSYETALPNAGTADAQGLFKIVLPGYDDEPEWEEVGMCDFTDGILSPAFGLMNNKYKVLVEKSLIEKDVYRVANPYGPESGLVDEAPESTYYMTFSVADPDFVLIGEVNPGIYVDSNVEIWGTSIADFFITRQGQSEEEVKAAGLGAQFNNNVLTLPGDQAVYLLANYNTGNLSAGTYEEEYQVETVLDLNTAVKSEGGEENVTPESVVRTKLNHKGAKFIPMFTSKSTVILQ